MKYIPKGKIVYDTNLEDDILAIDWNESELENDDLKNYKAKVEYYIRQHQDEDTIAKLKTNKPLSQENVSKLEDIIWNELGSKDDYSHEYGDKPLGEFVREIVVLDMNAAKEAFAEYLNDASLNSNQIYFINQIVEYIVRNGLLKDLSVLQEAPFNNMGSIVDVFDDLLVCAGIRKMNIGTDVCCAFANGTKAALDDPNRSIGVDVFMKSAVAEVKKLAVEKIKLLGANGKVK